MQGKENLSNYGEQKVHQMLMKRYRMLRNQGLFESLQDIYSKQPVPRIEKDNYAFSFQTIKNHIEDQMSNQSKLKKILIEQSAKTRQIEVRKLREVTFDNESLIYNQRLKSGLPIFKSIQYLRYQDNENWTELFGEKHSFLPDQSTIDQTQTKADVSKIRLFLEDQRSLNRIELQFNDVNTLDVKHARYPSLGEMDKRADILAKVLLYALYVEQHRKLKQSWKNDENYLEMQKNEKKFKEQIQPEKLKQNEQAEEEEILRRQVEKILFNLEEKANMIAHEQFKQMNGEKAVQTKKSLQDFKTLVLSETNPRIQLKMLISYKQKKTW